MILTAIALLGLTGVTMARYVKQQSQKGIVEAADFYFTSDYLKDEAEKAAYFVDPGKNFSVQLYNFADTKRVTPGEITYTVTVDGGSVGTVSGSLTGSVDAGGAASIEITPDAGTEQVTVTAASTSPYQKTLTAVFHRKLGNQYLVEDTAGSRAAALIMTFGDSGKSITIDLPDGVIPDETDDRVAYSGNQCTFTSPGNGVYSLILLKSDASILLEGDHVAFADRITIRQNP